MLFLTLSRQKVNGEAFFAETVSGVLAGLMYKYNT
jgi:hypothetical protein